MKSTLFHLSLLMAAIGAPASQQPPAPALILPCRVDHIRDGDTVEVVVETRYAIRLMDCWTHETDDEDPVKKFKAIRSTEALTRHAKGQRGTMVIPFVEKDGQLVLGRSNTFDRFTGRVWLDGDATDLSAWMVGEGWATKTKKELED